MSQVVNNLGNTKTVSHALTPSMSTNSWLVSIRGDCGKCMYLPLLCFSISYLFYLEPNGIYGASCKNFMKPHIFRLVSEARRCYVIVYSSISPCVNAKPGSCPVISTFAPTHLRSMGTLSSASQGAP